MLDSENSFIPQSRVDTEKPKVSEIDKTKRALELVLNHEFRFGYKYAFEQGLATLKWNKDKTLFIYIIPCKPDDDVWYGNCNADAWVSREFLKQRVGNGATIAVQKIKAEEFTGRMGRTEHYRLLVEHHDDSGGSRSIFQEVDHSPFFRSAASGERATIQTWVETEEIKEGERGYNRLDATSFFPMSEYKIDGQEKILYFRLEVEEEKQTVYIVMQQMDSADQEQKIDGLRYPIYFNQLNNPQVLLDDIENNSAFKPDGPFGDRMHETTLNQMKQGLALVVAALPAFEL